MKLPSIFLPGSLSGPLSFCGFRQIIPRPVSLLGSTVYRQSPPVSRIGSPFACIGTVRSLLYTRAADKGKGLPAGFPHLFCPYYIGRAAPVKQGGPPVIKPLRAFIYFHFCGQPASPLFVRVSERGRGQNADSSGQNADTSGQNADSLGTKCRQ